MPDQLTREDIAEILYGVRDAVEGIGSVASAIRDQDRRARWSARLGAAVVLLVAFVGGLTWSSRQVVDVLEDCTRPGGQCYAESQRRSAEIVGPVGESLERIEQRGDVNHRLLCLGVPDTRRPPDLCPPDVASPTTTVP